MRRLGTWAAAAAIVALAGTAQAALVFQGRLADGTPSSTCTVSGPGKCAMFYDVNLDITILNDWNIGPGFWSATAAPGSAQALAKQAGEDQTDFTGWVLPTGNRLEPAGALNQYRSIWNDVGGSLAGLQGQFDGVQPDYYWSGTEIIAVNGAWDFYPVFGIQFYDGQDSALYAVAVRPGDVTAAVPEPQTLALALLALGATVVARKRRSR